MTVRCEFSYKGFEQYLEVLANAPLELDASIDRANIAGADVILEGMQRRVRRRTENLALHLKRSEPQSDGNVRWIEVGIDPEADADTHRYGNVNEFGSSSMAAQPYVRPAFDEDRAAARRAQRESLQKDAMI